MVRSLVGCAVSAMDVDGSDMNFEDLEDDSDGEDSNNDAQLAPRAQVGWSKRALFESPRGKSFRMFSVCALPWAPDRLPLLRHIVLPTAMGTPFCPKSRAAVLSMSQHIENSGLPHDVQP